MTTTPETTPGTTALARPATAAEAAGRRRPVRSAGARPARTIAIDRYLETIYCIEGEDQPVRPGRLAQWLGVTAPTVSIALRRLRAGGWIETGEDRVVTLTPAGRRTAEETVRRHRLIECWLCDVLGMDWASAHSEAKRLAPALSDDVLRRLDLALGGPATCPHGHRIPGRAAPYGDLVPLTSLAAGVPATVRRVSEIMEYECFACLEELAAAGVGIGTQVSFETDGDMAVLRVSGGGDRRVTVPMSTAQLISVDAPAASA
ncbi:MAG TPA: metal-dependent transcriptional regulator [Candidatus Binatia bacterium]|nr:metal-dependent transcriptional regulator [Candidatus Binatia bacterium]